MARNKQKKSADEILLCRDWAWVKIKNDIKQCLAGLTPEQQKIVRVRLRLFTVDLERVQKMELNSRFAYWTCAFHIFNWLRGEHLLGQSENDFTDEIKEELREILSDDN